MQTDAAAFEAWALALRGWCGEKEVQSITLRWSEPIIKAGPDGAAAMAHYQRFLYRVRKFENYFPWFQVADRALLNASQLTHDGSYRLNIALSERTGSPDLPRRPPAELREHELECAFAFSPLRENLKQLLAADDLVCQVPVGVFADAVRKGQGVLCGGKSAIDLLAWDRKGSLMIVELKKWGAKKMGAVSELFFYSCVMREAAALGGQRFQFTEPKRNGYVPRELSPIREARRIRGYLLVGPEVHPLLERRVNGVFEQLNAATEADGLRFAVIRFNEHWDLSLEERPRS
jgi:hypothetical protein